MNWVKTPVNELHGVLCHFWPIESWKGSRKTHTHTHQKYQVVIHRTWISHVRWQQIDCTIRLEFIFKWCTTKVPRFVACHSVPSLWICSTTIHFRFYPIDGEYRIVNLVFSRTKMYAYMTNTTSQNILWNGGNPEWNGASAHRHYFHSISFGNGRTINQPTARVRGRDRETVVSSSHTFLLLYYYHDFVHLIFKT